MDAFETIDYHGYRIELHQDIDASSPAEWDQLGTVYALSSSAAYVGFESPGDWHGRAIEAMDRGGARLLRRYLSLCYGVSAVALQVNDYGSSGVQMNADDGADDTGDYYNAYIATDAKRIGELCGDDPEYQTAEWIDKALRGELNDWRAYFAGDVIGWVVLDPCGNEIGSCWGFYPGDGKLGDSAPDDYAALWNDLPHHLRPYADAISEAQDAADCEQAARDAALAKGIPTK